MPRLLITQEEEEEEEEEEEKEEKEEKAQRPFRALKSEFKLILNASYLASSFPAPPSSTVV